VWDSTKPKKTPANTDTDDYVAFRALSRTYSTAKTACASQEAYAAPLVAAEVAKTKAAEQRATTAEQSAANEAAKVQQLQAQLKPLQDEAAKVPKLEAQLKQLQAQLKPLQDEAAKVLQLEAQLKQLQDEAAKVQQLEAQLKPLQDEAAKVPQLQERLEKLLLKVTGEEQQERSDKARVDAELGLEDAVSQLLRLTLPPPAGPTH
jgi:TolA-binding protein